MAVTAVRVIDGDRVRALLDQDCGEALGHLAYRRRTQRTGGSGHRGVHAGVAVAQMNDPCHPEGRRRRIELGRPRRPEVRRARTGEAELPGGRRNDHDAVTLGAAAGQRAAREQRFIVRMSMEGH